VRYLGGSVIKYLRKHLEEALAGSAAPASASSWDGTEGRSTVEPGTEYPAERKWVFAFPHRRPAKVIGAWKAPSCSVE
jgi:hypothetical protein